MVRPDADDTAASAGTGPSLGLASSMIEEVFAQATEEQALSFFVAVGGRLAASHALEQNDGLALLEQTINRVWHRLGLGQASLAMDRDGIAIDHQGYAAERLAESRAWPKVAGALLQGAYHTWFQAVGGDAVLTTRIVRQTSDRITLHHGL